MRIDRWFSILALCLLSFGCGVDREKPDFTILNGTEPETLDPHIITGQPEFRLVEALFEGLYAHDAITAEAVPGIAKRHDLSTDLRTYTFHLRDDARWSNGEPLTARDFVESWRRALEPETAADYAYLLYFIKNAKSFNEGTLKDFAEVGVRAMDDRTLRVELDYPTPFFIDLTALPALFPVHMPTLKKYGDDWLKPGRMVSNGAYRLKDWRLNDRLDLEKNPHYWDASNVQLELIRALPTRSALTAFSIYAAGEADLILDKGLTPIYLLDELRRRADFHSATFLGTFFYRFNVTRKPFDDPRVRKALAMTIDRDLI
ncbi:MAG: peptide ABC transporter substrate-binding protein, partial [Acidobacteria bacterium]|nr:peptide ABC transporter substrate-binding protein [Acidobacteriota bacterium]